MFIPIKEDDYIFKSYNEYKNNKWNKKSYDGTGRSPDVSPGWHPEPYKPYTLSDGSYIADILEPRYDDDIDKLIFRLELIISVLSNRIDKINDSQTKELKNILEQINNKIFEKEIREVDI
jgi:hypothetical protein